MGLFGPSRRELLYSATEYIRSLLQSTVGAPGLRKGLSFEVEQNPYDETRQVARLTHDGMVVAVVNIVGLGRPPGETDIVALLQRALMELPRNGSPLKLARTRGDGRWNLEVSVHGELVVGFPFLPNIDLSALSWVVTTKAAPNQAISPDRSQSGSVQSLGDRIWESLPPDPASMSPRERHRKRGQERRSRKRDKLAHLTGQRAIPSESERTAPTAVEGLTQAATTAPTQPPRTVDLGLLTDVAAVSRMVSDFNPGADPLLVRMRVNSLIHHADYVRKVDAAKAYDHAAMAAAISRLELVILPETAVLLKQLNDDDLGYVTRMAAAVLVAPEDTANTLLADFAQDSVLCEGCVLAITARIGLLPSWDLAAWQPDSQVLGELLTAAKGDSYSLRDDDFRALADQMGELLSIRRGAGLLEVATVRMLQAALYRYLYARNFARVIDIACAIHILGLEPDADYWHMIGDRMAYKLSRLVDVFRSGSALNPAIPPILSDEESEEQYVFRRGRYPGSRPSPDNIESHDPMSKDRMAENAFGTPKLWNASLTKPAYDPQEEQFLQFLEEVLAQRMPSAPQTPQMNPIPTQPPQPIEPGGAETPPSAGSSPSPTGPTHEIADPHSAEHIPWTPIPRSEYPSSSPKANYAASEFMDTTFTTALRIAQLVQDGGPKGDPLQLVCEAMAYLLARIGNEVAKKEDEEYAMYLVGELSKVLVRTTLSGFTKGEHDGGYGEVEDGLVSVTQTRLNEYAACGPGGQLANFIGHFAVAARSGKLASSPAVLKGLAAFDREAESFATRIEAMSGGEVESLLEAMREAVGLSLESE